jgi:protein O-GlcNAcase / histone acetyltransferase
VTAPAATFLSGAIEGFYGKPWSAAERLELFDWLWGWGLNTYLYAPKDDLHHRAIWREPYNDGDLAALAQLIAACRSKTLRFVFAISPGLDIRYGEESEIERLRSRLEQMLGAGCQDFAILFDDIPDQFDARSSGSDSLAAAQCRVANATFAWLRARLPAARFLFCPTAYCGTMVEQKLGGEDYLPTIGRELSPGIDVLWTGPQIVSRQITVDHAREIGRLLQRKPLIWDNLHANDYDSRRFFCGPYAGRPPELRAVVAGLLSNPNNEFPLNYVPLRTLAEFCAADGTWDPRAAYLRAMREWLPRFETVRGPVALDDLVLFGDCYYLPKEEGPGVNELAASRERRIRLRTFCDQLTEVWYRPLFYAVSTRLWDVRKQLDRLDRP